MTALVMIYLWMPETKQRTLEELDYVFAVPTRKHMSYQVFKALPYWFKRYVFRQKVTLEPLYKFEKVALDERLVEGVRQQKGNDSGTDAGAGADGTEKHDDKSATATVTTSTS